jgi:hypothetical protein
MPEFGLIQGLAQDLQYDQRINDLRYQEEAMRRAKASSDAKAKLFSDDMDFQNASNQFDNPIIKQKGKEIIAKIGAFVRENPDWEGDVNKRSQLNLLKRELKDNPDLIRGVASDNNYKQYVADLQEVAKNPNQHDSDAYNSIGEQWNNYLKFGNQNGEEAAKTEGPKAFLYSKPKDFIDVNKEFAAVGNNFKDMRVKTIKGGMGAYEEYANPDSLKTVASQMYAQNQRQIDKIAASKGMAPIDYVMAGINAHIPKKRDMGDYSLAKEMAMARYKAKMSGGGGPEADTYKTSIVDRDHSVVSSDLMDSILGPGAKTIITSNDGKQVIDLTGINAKRTGYNFYADPNKGVKYAEATAYIPLEQAVEMGIVKSGFGIFTDDEVAPEFNKFAKIESKEGEDGKVHKAVKVTVFNPFDVNNAANAGVFNAKTMTSKQRPLPEQEYQQSGSQIMVDEAGNLFDVSSGTPKFIGKKK